MSILVLTLVQKEVLQLSINKTVIFAQKEMKNNILEDCIHLVSLTENTYLLKELKYIKQIIKETPNDLELGEKLRKVL